MVGRLAPEKGQDVFLRALAGTRILPREVFLIGGLYPGDENYVSELELLTTALDLPVTFTGRVEELEPYLRHADILVQCSLRPEPFRRVVREGMRAGCAVIATRPLGAEKIIEPGINGLLVDPGDRARLTRALDTLITDQELRTKFAEAARIRAADFDITDSTREPTLCTPTLSETRWRAAGGMYA